MDEAWPDEATWADEEAWAADPDDIDDPEDEGDPEDDADSEDEDQDDVDGEGDLDPETPAVVAPTPAASTAASRSARDRRSHGSDLIAQMLQEQEGDRSQAVPPGSVPGPEAAPRRRRGGRGGMAVVVAVALVAGVGAGVLFASGLIGAPSKSSYVAKADAVCKTTDGTLAATAKPASYAALSTAAGTFFTAAGGQLGRLRGVERPGGNARSGATSVLRAMDATVQSSHRLQLAAAGGDDATVASAARDMSAVMADAGTKAKAFGFAACGSGLGQGAGTLAAGSKDLVKAAVATKGNGICRVFAHDIKAIPKARSAKDAVPYLNQTYQLTQKLLADLKGLPVAPGDETTFSGVVAALNKEGAKLTDLRDAALAGNVARIDQLNKDTSVDIALNLQLDNYGLSDCGTGFAG